MMRTPNRDKAIRMMAQHGLPARPLGSRRGNTFRLDLRGPVLHRGEPGPGINADAVIAGLKDNWNAGFVTVDIDSEGGNLQAAKDIYSALRNHQGFKLCNASDLCASAATLILLAGDFRTADAGTRFLIHEVERIPKAGERWTAKKHTRMASSIKGSTEELVKLYAERTGQATKLFAQEIQNEKSMDVARARKFGLIHCPAGEERWINGRPYHFEGTRSDERDRMIAKMTIGEVQSAVRRNPKLWVGTPYGYLAFATPCRSR